MKICDIGLDKLIHREGVRLKAYRDSVGVWTIGVGHTSAAGAPKVVPGLTITMDQCNAILAADLTPIETAIARAVKVDLAQNEFDALVSVVFNIGTPGFLRSTFLRRLNAGDRKGCANALMMWNKPPEIIGRRETERQQFLTPYPVN